ncbi:MAG: hypothetical protein DRP12_00640 [Candidatus Aenigmatarchaeota archaeon]|nr:MAG: hypothetical protein DRP12_00640 [Candidatus Aenigmarchaeota archaeon]
MNLVRLYKRLLSAFGPQGWWPCSGRFRPREWEICLGAVLTQATTWRQAERALERLWKAGITTPRKLLECQGLEELIRPAGYFRQKARRLKDLAKLVLSFPSFSSFLSGVTRDQLLQIKGIGPETADAILLYACRRPVFVIDAYTFRLASRLGIPARTYHQLQSYFESRLPKDIRVYQEFHALIVQLGKLFCRPKPACDLCPLKSKECPYPTKP